MTDPDKIDRIADFLVDDHVALMAENKRLHDEIEALRAEIEALRKQEPVAWQAVGGTIWGHKTSPDDRPLYAAPGAHPDHLRDATKMVPQKLTPDGHYGQQHHYAEGWNDCLDAMLAAAQEDKS